MRYLSRNSPRLHQSSTVHAFFLWRMLFAVDGQIQRLPARTSSSTSTSSFDFSSFPLLQCRVKVVRISKNHIVNNLVVAYLKEHPGIASSCRHVDLGRSFTRCADKRRSAEELEALDKENKITHDMVSDH